MTNIARATSSKRCCNGLARRRIGFYERCGFTFNDYPYTQPPISKGRRPVPLRLMSTDGALTEAAFEMIRNTLYRDVYHV